MIHGNDEFIKQQLHKIALNDEFWMKKNKSEISKKVPFL